MSLSTQRSQQIWGQDAPTLLLQLKRPTFPPSAQSPGRRLSRPRSATRCWGRELRDQPGTQRLRSPRLRGLCHADSHGPFPEDAYSRVCVHPGWGRTFFLPGSRPSLKNDWSWQARIKPPLINKQPSFFLSVCVYTVRFLQLSTTKICEKFCTCVKRSNYKLVVQTRGARKSRGRIGWNQTKQQSFLRFKESGAYWVCFMKGSKMELYELDSKPDCTVY